VELKRNGGRQASPSVMRLNRTRVELKRLMARDAMNGSTSLNRTRVELKHISKFPLRVHCNPFESNQSGIETLAPVKYPLMVVTGLNRTRVELKRVRASSFRLNCFV